MVSVAFLERFTHRAPHFTAGLMVRIHFPPAVSQTNFVRRRVAASAVVTSNLDLSAELNYAVRRDAEELGRPGRNACQGGIEALAPPCHSGTRT
jgi:hypothetical protein